MESPAFPQAEAEVSILPPLNPAFSELTPPLNPASFEPEPQTNNANHVLPSEASLVATEQAPRKHSAIPEHLASVPPPPKCSKPLTALQELLAVVNSTVDDSPEPQPSPKLLKPLDRLKQGVENFKKLNHPKQKKKAPKLGLTKKKSLLQKQPSPEVGPITPLPKQESAVEANKRVLEEGGSSERESSPEEKRSHKKKIPLINIGERILIYWPIDGVFYAGTVIEHVVPKHRYTVLYEDNEVEVLDLSKEIWRPGTLDPKKERLPGEGVPPTELGLPSEGEIPHYMPPRKRRRLIEKTKKGSKLVQSTGKKTKVFRGKKLTEGVGKKEMEGEERRASVQELGAVEALLGVAGNKFGENVVARKDSPGGPIYIGLKRKRSKQADRGTSPKVTNGWSNLPGALQPSTSEKIHAPSLLGDPFSSEQAAVDGSHLNGDAAVSLPPDVQQILSDFERKKLENKAHKGKRKGHKRKRKFTAKAKGKVRLPGELQVVRKRKPIKTFKMFNSEKGIATGTKVDNADATKEELNNCNIEPKLGADEMYAIKHVRVMRRSALEAQKKIEASAGGTIALTEADPFRRSTLESPRKRVKRETAVNPVGLSISTEAPVAVLQISQVNPQLPENLSPKLPGSEAPLTAEQKPALRRLWWVEAFGAKAPEPSFVMPNHSSFGKLNPSLSSKPERAWAEADCAVSEEVGETKANGISKEADTGNVEADNGASDPANHEAPGVATQANGNGHFHLNGFEPSGENTPDSGNDLETSPKGEVLDVGDGVNGLAGIAKDDVNRPNDISANGVNRLGDVSAKRTVLDTIKRASGRGVDPLLRAGGNEPSGVNGPEMSRVESESTAALQPQLENASSGQVSGVRHKLAAKTLVDCGGVARWLEGLGLARLAPLFAEHEVVEDALPQLTSEDLKEMGVKAVGTRRLILNNIELLKQGIIADAQGHVA